MGYWQGADWWGVGPGAHSHVRGVRWWNVKHPAAYAGAIGRQVSARPRVARLSMPRRDASSRCCSRCGSLMDLLSTYSMLAVESGSPDLVADGLVQHTVT